MKQVIFAAALLGVVLLSQTASAHNRNINRTQHNQKERIHQGVHNGQLTRNEAVRLRMQQAKIGHYKQMAKADGRITRPERRMIKQEQIQANRAIYHQKHDRQKRYNR